MTYDYMKNSKKLKKTEKKESSKKKKMASKVYKTPKMGY
tara:strand:+ start:250 stop:366 length:117 start_codon:yes stop_codon:yes gene_type:complete